MKKDQSMFYTGSVYSKSKDDKIVVYRKGTLWIAETNYIDCARNTKREIMALIKSLGYTKFIGYEALSQ